MRPDGALRTAALNTPSAARPAPVAAITVAAADGWSMASAKAIGGHHNRARSGAGMVHSPGSGTMLLGYPLPVASLDAVTVHRHDDVLAVGGTEHDHRQLRSPAKPRNAPGFGRFVSRGLVDTVCSSGVGQ